MLVGAGLDAGAGQIADLRRNRFVRTLSNFRKRQKGRAISHPETRVNPTVVVSDVPAGLPKTAIAWFATSRLQVITTQNRPFHHIQ